MSAHLRVWVACLTFVTAIAIPEIAFAQLFGPPQSINGASGGVRAFTAADINADSWPDLVYVVESREREHSVAVRFNLGGGAFSGEFLTDLPTGRDFVDPRIRVFDLTTDGFADVLIFERDGPMVLRGDGAGGFTPVEIGDILPRLGGFASSDTDAAFADFDRDGISDIVLAPQLWFFKGTGGGNYVNEAFPMSTSIDGDIEAVDMDHDGTPDIVGRTTLGVAVVRGNGDGTFGPKQEFELDGEVVHALAVGDVTGDGRPDVMAATYVDASASRLFLLAGTKSGLTPPVEVSTIPYLAEIVIADVNADDIGDVIVGNPEVAEIAVILGRAGSTPAGTTRYPALINRYLAVADFNADGHPDVAIGYGSPEIGILFHTLPLEIDAGEDLMVTAIGSAAIVSLSAAVRSAQTGVTFVWRSDGTALGTGATVTASLAAGSHTITVEGFAPNAWGTDVLTVTVTTLPVTDSVDLLHQKVDALGAPAQASALAEVASSVSDQSILIGSVLALVNANLNATVSSRASSAELQAAVETLRNSGVSQASLDALGSSIAAAVAGARKDLLQAQIEAALVQRQTIVTFVLPASQGGQLETVRQIVADAIAKYPASSRNRINAQKSLAQGDAWLAARNYAAAYVLFGDAYLALTK